MPPSFEFLVPFDGLDSLLPPTLIDLVDADMLWFETKNGYVMLCTRPHLSPSMNLERGERPGSLRAENFIYYAETRDLDALLNIASEIVNRTECPVWIIDDDDCIVFPSFPSSH